MYDDKEVKKKVLGGLTSFLSDRMAERMKPKSSMEIIEIKGAPKGDTGAGGGDEFHSDGKATGNFERDALYDPGVARGDEDEGPMDKNNREESADLGIDDTEGGQDPQKADVEDLQEDGMGLGDHEKEDLKKVYGSMK